jgi:CRP-like cAMP-binding protein
MEKGAGFGELALIYNDKRSATIEALEDCEVYALDGMVFKSIVIKSSMQKRAQLAGFLNSIKLFDSLDQQKKLKLVDGL